MSKINLEKALEKESADFQGQVIILRPAFIYGPGNFSVWHEALRLVRDRKMLLIGDGDAPLPLIYAEDLARFVSQLLNEPSLKSSFDIYVVASSEPTTMKQIFYFIADYLHVKRPRAIPGWPLSLAAFALSFFPEKLKFGRCKLLTKARLSQYSKGYDLSGLMTPSPLGFVASTNFREGLSKMLDDYKKSTALFEQA